ncbi:MAG: nucleoside triphosphate pyrophosphohydrolase [Sphingomonadaceae bacterium]|uniref:nucleoside triphosphate pyrophosphohydrolase n=1 Tax=Thermaurantiacus sp. TaxID=2820283 RepID=UPI00298ED218|nr:nucleoside triphosphate pyrophosphohydrolase [Thermaurantiacus sp.]MCS6985835.1 nucleoside triphosphate pyrophosphohydrolase [Sphingomonadaceae bacterium]MDW8413896.1 nucleoside triphosphate pyrophosphohydrolase [Thermaurantiacus sp.]
MTHRPSTPDLGPLVALMARLRDPTHGCPWDLAQNFATIAPYTIEEAYEVADAIGRGDMAELQDELGDLLFQVVFHARLAEEAGHFTLADVIAGLVAKLIRRHPHVFSDATAADAEEVRANWERLKEAERGAAGSVLDEIPRALPALLRARKLSDRAARTGFDWPDAAAARAKVLEELAELDRAADPEGRHEEAGDLLFALVNWLRKLDLDAEDALRAANAKFEARFRAIEATPGFRDLPLAAKEALWQRAKGSPETQEPVEREGLEG